MACQRTAWWLVACAMAIDFARGQELSEHMQSMQRAFAAVGSALLAGDAALTRPALELAACAEGIPAEIAGHDETVRQAFGEWRARAIALARELTVAAPERALAAHVVRDLRSACVSCHAATRPDVAVDVLPAARNTVAGSVRLFTQKGDERPRRADVLVFLDGDLPRDAADPHRDKARVRQQNTGFSPRVLPILVGSQVEFPNDDVIWHNVFSLSETLPFDLGKFGPGKSGSVRFDRQGLVRVHCNMHPQMAATIVVLTNRWFTLTDSRGSFALTDVPDGNWRLRTWHEFGGDIDEVVAVQGGGLRRELVIRENRATLPHKNKFGQPYRQKY